MRTRGLVIVGLALVLIIGAAGGALLRARRARRAAGARPDAVAIPPATVGTDSQRIKVEVLNLTPTRGLARRAALYLRDRGFDVVSMGNAKGQGDSTLVLDRSRHPDWARRVAATLGNARVEERPDSSRYLDVTVLLGRSWHPPAEPFRP